MIKVRSTCPRLICEDRNTTKGEENYLAAPLKDLMTEANLVPVVGQADTIECFK